MKSTMLVNWTDARIKSNIISRRRTSAADETESDFSPAPACIDAISTLSWCQHMARLRTCDLRPTIKGDWVRSALIAYRIALLTPWIF